MRQPPDRGVKPEGVFAAHSIHKAASLALIALALTGCVAVWGQAYDIEQATSESVTIRYDRNFATLDEVDKIARKNCAESGKMAVEQHESTSVWRITTVSFNCVQR